MNRKTINTKTAALAGMLGAISAVLMMIDFSLPLFPSFMKFDLGELPALFGGFFLGLLEGELGFAELLLDGFQLFLELDLLIIDRIPASGAFLQIGGKLRKLLPINAIALAEEDHEGDGREHDQNQEDGLHFFTHWTFPPETTEFPPGFAFQPSAPSGGP